MKYIRWGVIGAGGIADRRTLPGMMQCSNAKLISIMEVDPEVSSRLRLKYDAKRAYTDEDQLLADAEIDAVYIASPVYLHAKQAMKAAEAGKHILIEKPLALTCSEGQQVIEYCKEKGVKIATGFMMRFGACVQAMKAAVHAGKIGNVVSINAQFTCWYPDIPGSWRQKLATAGGGALTDMGVHVIDLVRFITGNEIRQVAAMHGTNTFSYEVEDSACALLRLDNNALCSIHANFNIPDEASRWRLELFGTKGRLSGENVIGQEDSGNVNAVFLSNNEEYNAQQDTGSIKADTIEVTYGNLYAKEIESFSNSILFNRELEVPAEAAVKAQAVIEAAYLSNNQGIIVSV